MYHAPVGHEPYLGRARYCEQSQWHNLRILFAELMPCFVHQAEVSAMSRLSTEGSCSASDDGDDNDDDGSECSTEDGTVTDVSSWQGVFQYK